MSLVMAISDGNIIIVMPYLGHGDTPYLGHAETLPTSVMRRHSLLQADTPYFVTIVLDLLFGFNQT